MYPKTSGQSHHKASHLDSWGQDATPRCEDFREESRADWLTTHWLGSQIFFYFHGWKQLCFMKQLCFHWLGSLLALWNNSGGKLPAGCRLQLNPRSFSSPSRRRIRHLTSWKQKSSDLQRKLLILLNSWVKRIRYTVEPLCTRYVVRLVHNCTV